MGLPNSEIVALAVDPNTPSTVYAGAFVAGYSIFSGGVFKSQDGGDTWATYSRGLAATGIRSLAIDSASPTTVYAATSGNGVFATSGDGFPATFHLRQHSLSGVTHSRARWTAFPDP